MSARQGNAAGIVSQADRVRLMVTCTGNISGGDAAEVECATIDCQRIAGFLTESLSVAA